MSESLGAAPRVDKAACLRHALAAMAGGNYDVGRTWSQAILASQPDDSEASYILGLCLGAEGSYRDSAALLHRVRVDNADMGHPVLDLTAIMRRIGHATEIVPQLRECLRLAPDDAILIRALAEELCETGAPQEAIEVLSPLLRTHPRDAAAQLLMGIFLHDLGALDEAMARFRVAASLLPDASAPWANIGLLETIAGRFPDALAAYDKAIRLGPEDARIRLNRAIALLQAGRMKDAWFDYECRFRVGGRAPPFPLSRMLPSIKGIGSLAGRTVLLTHEDGFGDTFQFIRYAPLLARHGARVLVHAPQPLERLLRMVPGINEVLTASASVPNFDYFCPMFSLPRAFGTDLHDIPAEIPYLRADPSDVVAWAARLPPSSGPRVGLVWAGQARPWAEGFRALDNRRSLALAALAPLAAVPGVGFVSLQAGPPSAEAFCPPAGMKIHNPMPFVADFADTAAIIENLDLVISVDTSVAHLAGALGKPVFLLDRFDNCWRWLSGRKDSPWYPSLRIFRQKRMGDWAPVLADAAAALADFSSSYPAGDAPTAASVRGIRSVSIS